jgi:hypothetical protein
LRGAAACKHTHTQTKLRLQMGNLNKKVKEKIFSLFHFFAIVEKAIETPEQNNISFPYTPKKPSK